MTKKLKVKLDEDFARKILDNYYLQEDVSGQEDYDMTDILDKAIEKAIERKNE